MEPQTYRGLLLLSGGFDSPVAGYRTQRKGGQLLALHFSSEPFTDATPESKCRKIAELLGFDTLYIANLSKALELISNNCSGKFYFVLMKRLMLRVAEKLAAKESCAFLVTGENLGQVSSQTLKNLATINSAVQIPVIRPLISYNKNEIVHLAKIIGTYDISKGPELCDVLGPRHPSTAAKPETIAEEESKLNLENLDAQVLETLRA